MTFRDHFLSLYQSLAADVARKSQRGALTQESLAPRSAQPAADVILAAETIAATRAEGHVDAPSPTADVAARARLEEMPALQQASACASLGLRLLEARLVGDSAAVAALEGDLTAGTCDPAWITTGKEYLKYFGPSGTRRDPLYVTPAQAGDAVLSLKAGARVALIGDWGTGAGPAKRILDLIAQQKPDVLIHLGDIYYSGTETECRENFEGPIEAVFGPAATRIPIFTLAGNHDMYCGGVGYYGLIQRLNAPPMRQNASFFCLRSADSSWQLLAMDTGRHDYSPLSVTSALTFVEPAEEDWLKARLTGFAGKTILLSHHQLFSAFSQIGKPDGQKRLSPVNPNLRRTLQGLAGTGAPIAAWFWGHEHNLCVYEPYADLGRGRCLGHGAVPVFAADTPYTPLDALTDVPKLIPQTQLSTVDGYYAHGFAMLMLSGGGQGQAEYFEDRDGVAHSVYTEDL